MTGFFDLPEIDLPHIIEAEIVTMIEYMMASHPRTLQTAMGPSEVGNPCSRKLIHQLAGHGSGETDNPFRDRWAAQVGTFVHAGLEAGVRAFMAANPAFAGRYLLEHRVTVGSVGGVEISGNADIFDVDAGLVGDYKAVGPNPLLRYQSKGPGPQYRSQAHLYGRGFAAQGYTVNTVMIMFLPRAGDLGSSKLKPGSQDWVNRGQRYFWSEPYDESVAVAALARLQGLYDLMQAFGVEALLPRYQPCGSIFCGWCSRR